MTLEGAVDGLRWSIGLLCVLVAVLYAWVRFRGHFYTAHGQRLAEGLALLGAGSAGWSLARYLGMHELIILVAATVTLAGFVLVFVGPLQLFFGRRWAWVAGAVALVLSILGGVFSDV